MKNKKRTIFRLAVFSLTCLFIISLGGCAPLRKKFTRQKKKGDEFNKIQPVLEPIDYSKEGLLAKDRYSYHFSLWRALSGEMIKSIEMDSSDKRQKHLLDLLVEQLGGMRKWLNDQAQLRLDEVIKDVEKVENEFKKPRALRNSSSITLRLEKTERKIKKDFSPTEMEAYLRE